MAALTAAALSWKRDIDFSGPDGNLMRSLVTLTITAVALDTWAATPLALPALAIVGLQNVKLVRGLPPCWESGDSTFKGQIPVIDYSTPTAPTIDFYQPATNEF